MSDDDVTPPAKRCRAEDDGVIGGATLELDEAGDGGAPGGKAAAVAAARAAANAAAALRRAAGQRNMDSVLKLYVMAAEPNFAQPWLARRRRGAAVARRLREGPILRAFWVGLTRAVPLTRAAAVRRRFARSEPPPAAGS